VVALVGRVLEDGYEAGIIKDGYEAGIIKAGLALATSAWRSANLVQSCTPRLGAK
jgi:hypothetical protein